MKILNGILAGLVAVAGAFNTLSYGGILGESTEGVEPPPVSVIEEAVPSESSASESISTKSVSSEFAPSEASLSESTSPESAPPESASSESAAPASTPADNSRAADAATEVGPITEIVNVNEMPRIYPDSDDVPNVGRLLQYNEESEQTVTMTRKDGIATYVYTGIGMTGEFSANFAIIEEWGKAFRWRSQHLGDNDHRNYSISSDWKNNNGAYDYGDIGVGKHVVLTFTATRRQRMVRAEWSEDDETLTIQYTLNSYYPNSDNIPNLLLDLPIMDGRKVLESTWVENGICYVEYEQINIDSSNGLTYFAIWDSALEEQGYDYNPTASDDRVIAYAKGDYIAEVEVKAYENIVIVKYTYIS